LVGLFGLVALAGKEPLMIYTSVPIEIMTKIEEAFEAAHPDIDLQIYRSGTGKVTAKIAAEREAGRIQADLIWVADYSYFEELKAADLLYSYESPQVDKLLPAFVDKDHCYYAARVICMIIAYNTTLVSPDEAPKTWEDLLDPGWAGLIAMGNPQYSGAVKVLVTALAHRYGIVYFEKLRANDIAIVKGNSKTAAEVAAGAYDVGVTLDYIVRNNKAQGSPIDLVYPDDGAVMIPSPIGIVKTSDHLGAAKNFLDFVLSPEGQQAIVKYGSFIPVRTDVPLPEGAPSLDELKVLDVPLDYLTKNKDYYTDEFVRIVMEQ
jgi:iron(III) transport system substrate-binding protein